MKPNVKPWYGRFKGLSWFNKITECKILVGGAGGIGSHLAFQLARTGASIAVVDNDVVGEENLAGQLYGKSDIGKKKVVAISDVVTRLCGENTMKTLDELVEKTGGTWRRIMPMLDVVCVGFDNLEARHIVYEEWKKNGKATSLFVDGRLAAENGQVYFVQKKAKDDDFLAYEETYFSSEERIELPCTMKATTHCGAMIASFMVAQIVNWCNNQTEGTMERNMAHIEFNLPLMLFEQPVLKIKNYVAEEIS